MVLRHDLAPFWDWLLASQKPFWIALLALAALGLFFGYLSSAVRNGPFQALRWTAFSVWNGIAELFQLSPRRILAMAKLSFQESIRKRVLVVFIVFVIGLLFAGWFLDRNSDHPARLYISFVLTATGYLMLFLSVFLSAFSIPNDLKSRTIYTVVTKPVRAWEIVIGRMLGFCAIGTVLLAMMGLFSYVFVVRGLKHAHQIDVAELTSENVEVDGQTSTEQQGQTNLVRGHRHNVMVNQDGVVTVLPNRDHSHAHVGEGDDLTLGDPDGQLLARVPIMGELRFLRRDGRPGDGYNVGNEWEYRSYIEGGTLSTAIWRFKDLNDDLFADEYLPLEMTLRVFRTYKGEIEQGLTGTLQLVKPGPRNEDGSPKLDQNGNVIDGGLRSIPLDFTAKDQEIFERRIPRKLAGIDANGNEKTVDIFDNLTNENGEIEIWVRCINRMQYFGMARADLYLRAADEPFWLNFVKGYLGIWFQMVVVTCFGVMFSTFLNGAVAMLATLSAVVMGFFKKFVFDVASGDIPGGGPVESFVRLIYHENQMLEWNAQEMSVKVIRAIDGMVLDVVESLSYALPDAGQFNTSEFVANGYNIPANLIGQHAMISLAYVLVVTVAGYFFFKSREIAA
ncbi:MAG: hypothetical protein R3C28_11905 [Pirellulaceae bacterium]